MLRAEYIDKDQVVNILVSSFDDNKSVNYIIKQDNKRVQRIRTLMEYSFDICYLFGDIFLTDDKKGCALIVIPEKKKTTFKTMLLDANLAIMCMGLSNLKKAIKREASIKSIHPDGLIYYLWFIGVDPKAQNNGIGSNLLEHVINEGLSMKRKLCLETSTVKNILWYKKHGFSIYKELDFSYRLYCMKTE